MVIKVSLFGQLAAYKKRGVIEPAASDDKASLSSLPPSQREVQDSPHLLQQVQDLRMALQYAQTKARLDHTNELVNKLRYCCGDYLLL